MIDELKKRIENCGIVGAGGAGFPTHLKIDSRGDTILLNCAECEPLFKVHQQLLARYTHEILSALNKLSEVLDADVIIAIKKSYDTTISAVGTALNQYPRMRAVLLDDIYPAGDEILLIHEVLGVVVPPGALPIESGCIVLNVETVYNIYNALEHDLPVTQKWVTIAGEVERPITARIPIGTSIEKAVKRAGAITVNDSAFIAGGPMMGDLVSPSDKIKKTTNAVLVLSRDHFLVRSNKNNPSIDLNRAASACCQCRACTELCPRYLLGHPIEPHRIMQALCARDFSSQAFNGALYCCLCGLCEMVSCPQSLAPRSLIKTFKTALAKAGVRPEKQEAAPISQVKAYRKVDVNRLKIRLGLEKYNLDIPMED